MTWEGAVTSFQNVFRSDLAPGGLTALELHGFAHYLPLSPKRVVHLCGKDPLPNWLAGALSDIEFIQHRRVGALDDTALGNIAAALTRIAETIIKAMPGVDIIKSFEDRPDALRLFVAQGGGRIKIELSPVLRSSVFAVLAGQSDIHKTG